MSNKIHLGNTKILANESAEAGTEVITPNRSGTLALLTDIDGSEGGSGSGDWYTKAEIDSQQAVQDLAINNNAEDIKDNTDKIQANSDKNSSQDAAILLNATNINNNKKAIQTNSDEIEKLTGAIIYKGSIDATKTPAPVDARVGDMWINKYNPEFPNKYYTVTGWGSLTGVKFDDRLVKTETDWDRIENSTSSSYLVADDCIYLNKQEITNDYIMPPEFNGMTAGPLNVKADVSIPEGSEWSVIGSGGGGGAVDAYTKTETDAKLDLKADKSDTYTKSLVYTKTEADEKFSSGGSVDAYTKSETDSKLADKENKGYGYSKSETDTLLDNKADKSDTYTKSESYTNVEVDTKLYTKADKSDTYTKAEVDTIVGEGGGSGDVDLGGYYTKSEVDELIDVVKGAVISSYTHQRSESMYKDPGPGNCYIGSSYNFTSDYNQVAKIYVSYTDADGENRDFAELIAGDKIKLASENGFGNYIIVSTRDMSGTHRELVVTREDCEGTVINGDAMVWKVQPRAGGGAGALPPLVWKDVISVRQGDTEYINENSVPMWIRFEIETANTGSHAQVFIDKKRAAGLGYTNASNADHAGYHTAELLVPAGATYKINLKNDTKIIFWSEANMPVAAGTAGASAQMKSVETRLDKLEKLLRELT